jgi:hypothetical protein
MPGEEHIVFSKYPPVGPAMMTKVLGGQFLNTMTIIKSNIKTENNNFFSGLMVASQGSYF